MVCGDVSCAPWAAQPREGFARPSGRRGVAKTENGNPSGGNRPAPMVTLHGYEQPDWPHRTGTGCGVPPLRATHGGAHEETPTLALLATMLAFLIPAVARAATTPTSTEKQVIELVNKERTKRGLAPVKFKASLTYAARAHSSEMARRGKLTHTSANGKSFARRLMKHGYKRSGYRSWSAGEDIARAKKGSIYATPTVIVPPGWRAAPTARHPQGRVPTSASTSASPAPACATSRSTWAAASAELASCRWSRRDQPEASSVGRSTTRRCHPSGHCLPARRNADPGDAAGGEPDQRGSLVLRRERSSGRSTVSIPLLWTHSR